MQAIVELVIKHQRCGGAIYAAIVEAGLAKIPAAVIIGTLRVSTATGNAITVQVVQSKDQACHRGRTPRNARSEVCFVIAREVPLCIRVAGQANQTVGQRALFVQVVTKIEPDLFFVVATNRNIGFAMLALLGCLGDKIHGSTGI